MLYLCAKVLNINDRTYINIKVDAEIKTMQQQFGSCLNAIFNSLQKILAQTLHSSMKKKETVTPQC